MKLKLLSTEPKKPYQYLFPSHGALHGCVQQLTTSWMHNCNTSHSITWPQACKLQFQFSKSEIIPCCQPTSWICQNVLLVHWIDTWLLSKKQDSKDSLLGMYIYVIAEVHTADECGPDNSCCNHTGLPQFYRTLPQEVGDELKPPTQHM